MSEQDILDKVIDHAVDEMARHICNDTPQRIRKMIDNDFGVQISKEYDGWNGDPEEFDGSDDCTGVNFVLLRALWNRQKTRLSKYEQELSKYKAAYEVLREANEFYSKEKNWEGHDLYEFNGSAIEWDDTESLEPRGYKELIGGKCAREAKQKCEEILG